MVPGQCLKFLSSQRFAFKIKAIGLSPVRGEVL